MRAIVLLILAGCFAYFIYWVSLQDPNVQAASSVQKPGLYSLIVGAMDAQSTASAANAQAYQANQTANQYYAAATAQVSDFEREERAAQAQRTAIAADATAQAGSTSTAQAWAMVEWTATADASKATAQASQTAIAAQYTQVAIEQDIRSTQVAAEYLANTLRRAQEREEATNKFQAWMGYALVVIVGAALLLVLAIVTIKYWRTPVVIQRDLRGDIGALVGNNGAVWDMDRVIGGVVQQLKAGVTAPMLNEPDQQERHTARDQAVDLATRGLPGQMPPLQRNNKTAPKLPGAPNYKIYVEPQQPPELAADTALMQILEAQWREAK